MIGSGEKAFTLQWGERGMGTIYTMSDPQDLRSVALAPNVENLATLGDVTQYDNSSRTRTVKVGDAVIVENIYGYYAAARVLSVHTRETSKTGEHEVVFDYLIQPNRTSMFTDDPVE
jgi:hypothetical protein